ncbi:hypothetical protein L2784_10085 [Lactobacillus crispatus]|uniref:hypothetical protein n=1 Tax=Lactobacillus crispatus TaxID=47770 RepID=UPI0018C2E0C6|nr:hypothetical protein [Lactobacillus crispatus]MBG0720194.1 hypothetical protein [Lactobacillus crispatus]MCZ3643005.1 hypothetical protein [Lactobacillus crispatus]MCZ3645402.1 hypothetical protein [Lactobacillus crispatus]MCZ3647822.1 hypothetical protein [Lactobacillus crispatus]MCZ3650168.1 hypothetical protein [Lactobacillus crispatus]
MIELKSAMKLMKKESDENSKKFEEEFNQVENECLKFLDPKLIDQYLDKLVKDHATKGIADYKFNNFFEQNNLKDSWDKKRAELIKKYPTFTKLNDPTSTLSQLFYWNCEEILRHYGYTDENIDVYNHTFSWTDYYDSRWSATPLGKFIIRRHKNEQFKYQMATLRQKYDEEEKEREETRKMNKFAQILAEKLNAKK